MSKALAAKSRLVVALVAATSALASVPLASAYGGPPGGPPGGCNMLDASEPGLIQMMAGSQNGSGQANMFQMLALFPCG